VSLPTVRVLLRALQCPVVGAFLRNMRRVLQLARDPSQSPIDDVVDGGLEVYLQRMPAADRKNGVAPARRGTRQIPEHFSAHLAQDASATAHQNFVCTR